MTRDEYKNAKAGFLHLLDLKRAGHSPRRTELHVDRWSNRIIAAPRRPPAPKKAPPK